jgi:hypothetical protein
MRHVAKSPNVEPQYIDRLCHFLQEFEFELEVELGEVDLQLEKNI